MEEKNNSRENLEKGKNNKTLIIVLVVLGIILLIGIVFCIINRNADNNKNNNDNNKDNDVVDKDKNENKLKTTRYEISKDNLYVSEQEKKYSDYQRNQKVTIDKDNGYYIENKKLYYRKNNDILEINVNDETPKYLAVGISNSSCGGFYVACLTEEGNVYGTNSMSIFDFKKMYNEKNAKELVIFSESTLTDTCGSLSLYTLTEQGKLIKLNQVQDNEYKTREEIHQYSLSFSNQMDNNVLLYPNGKINKYIYSHIYSKIKNEFANIDGSDLLVSYIFIANNKEFIIDTNGIIYEVANINEELNEETLIKLEKSNVITEKISYVDILSNNTNGNVSQITLYGENGTKVEMIK